MFKAYKKLLKKWAREKTTFTMANFFEVLVNDEQATLE
jgi:hypothetical protein